MADSTKHRYNYKYLNSTTNTNQLVFSGAGVLHYITVNRTSATTIGVSDASVAANATANVAQLPSNAVVGTYRYDVSVMNGLVIVPGAHIGDVTVVYTQG